MTNSDQRENLQTEAQKRLDQLGRKVAELYDDAVLQTTFFLPGGNPRLQSKWEKYIDKQPDDHTKQIRLVQKALESLLHDVLFCLQEQREFRIQAITDTAQWINIDEYSDGIHGDLFDWLRRYSRYGCVTSELLDVE
jgi:hypothetical protein